MNPANDILSIKGVGEKTARLFRKIGIDTVELGGKGFRSFVNKGEQVSLGQKLITFDREQIKAAGYDDTTMLLVLNANDWGRLEINQTDCLEPSMKAMWFV